MTGMEKLRRAVAAFNNCNESFLDKYDPLELLSIYEAWVKSGWDILPDEWEEKQVTEALFGITPQWDNDTEKPVYTKVWTV